MRASAGHARAGWQPSAHDIDQSLIWVCVALLAWGLVMVYSASIALPDNPRFARYSPYHFVMRHGMWILLACMAACVVFKIPMKVWKENARWIFIGMLIMLMLVFPFGTVVNGARRWISLGPVNFQPSELLKIAMLLYVSDYMVRHANDRENFFKTVGPIAFAVGVTGMLLLAQPDMGTFMVITVIAFGILFLGGVNMKLFVPLGALLVTIFLAIIWASPWRRERIFAYLDPWSEQHALGKGYQLSHALIAIGRGEVWGVGLGDSIEKLHWLPEAHTDFLTAIIGEEFGLVGLVCLICLFFWLIKRIMDIGRQAILLNMVFSGLVAQGVGLWIGFQAWINLGVNLGALPTKGLTLPFMSYGGSAIVANLAAIALVLRVDWENRHLMQGGRS